MQFVELNRRFVQVKRDKDLDPEVRGALARMHITSMSWDDVLKHRRVVILAEAGMGKTEEVRAAARKLRTEDKAAFFGRLERLAEESLSSALEQPGDEQRFSAWLQCDKPATFFLDSVDEARLAEQSLEKALRKFAQALGSALSRVSVVITSRISDWRPQTDFATFNQWLPIRKKTNTKTTGQGNATESPVDEGGARDGLDDESKLPFIVLLAPLNRTQQETLFRAAGINDIAAIMDAIERGDTDIFVERPQDLLELAAYWKEHNKLGSLRDMVEFNVDRKLRERDPQRDRRRQLAAKKARHGAELLAATLTLCRRSEVSVPEEQIDIDRSDSTIDIRTALTDWPAADREALLTRPIFDKATYGRVRFHHRLVREYLTACWLSGLLAKDAPTRAVERLLVREQYGRRVVVPSMQPVASWLGQWNHRIRSMLLDVSPEVLIEDGDPSTIPVEDRAMMLRRFAEHHTTGAHLDSIIDIGAVRRLADPDLASVIRELFSKFRHVPEVCELLLRIIWQGKINACVDLALACAIDAALSDYVRDCGVRAVGAAGNDTQKRQLAELVLRDASTATQRILDQVCRALFPGTLSVQELLVIVENAPVPDRRVVGSGLASALEEHAVDACPSEAQDEYLAGLLDRVQRPPYIRDVDCRISQRWSWLLPAVARLATLILQSRVAQNDDETLFRAIELVGCAREYSISRSLDIDTLRKEVATDRQLNREFFWRSVAAQRQRASGQSLRSWWQAQHLGIVWALNDADFDLFLNDIAERTSTDDREIALTAAFSIWHNAGRDATQLRRLESAASHDVGLSARLKELLNPEETEQARQWRERHESWRREDLERKRKEELDLREYVEDLQRDPERLRDQGRLRSSDVFPYLRYFVHFMGENGGSNSRWGQGNWEDLIPTFGKDVAEAARDGIRLFWRQFDPPVRSSVPNRTSIPNGTMVGLSGLSIEARQGSGWAQKLSSDDAQRAARYATEEMNGFPEWIHNLIEVHTDAVVAALTREIAWEFEAEQEDSPHHVLGSLRWGDERLRAHFVAPILRLLRAREPRHDGTLDDALSILLRSETSILTELPLLAEQRFATASSEARELTWLAAWLCLAADGALRALEQWLEQAPNEAERDRRMISFCDALMTSRDIRFGSIHRDFERTKVLTRLIPLVFARIRLEEDNIHEEAYRPDARDHAERLRGYLVERVGSTPGQEAYDALKTLSSKRSTLPEWARQWCHRLALRRAAADAEETWQPSDVAEFGSKFERYPRSDAELFDVVLWRLDDITSDLRDGDISDAKLLAHARTEEDVQHWFASRLRDRPDRGYAVTREEEVVAKKKPDIRVHAPSVASPVSVEVKIADNWSFSELQAGLKTQLIGQYHRDRRSRYGIYLLTFHGRKRSWPSDKPSRRLTPDEVIVRLQNEANKLVNRNKGIEAIRVVGVDLRQIARPRRQRAAKIGSATPRQRRRHPKAPRSITKTGKVGSRKGRKR